MTVAAVATGTTRPDLGMLGDLGHRRPRCQSIGRGSQRTHMTPAAMTASRGGGQMQVLVSRVHSDNRVQKGQTHLDGHPAVSTEVRPAARFGDRRRDGRCACKGARALCSLDRNRGGHHLQTDTLREWQACRHVPVPCVRLFPTSSTRSETKAAGVGNYAISVSGDTGTSLAELSRSDKRRALAANRLIAQSSQNDAKWTFDARRRIDECALAVNKPSCLARPSHRHDYDGKGIANPVGQNRRPQVPSCQQIHTS